MALRLIQFLAIMLTAFALVPSGAHLAALPNKIAMAEAATPQIYAGWALFGMKSSRDSLPDGTGSFTTPLVWMFRATKTGALYAIIVNPVCLPLDQLDHDAFRAADKGKA
jgi:hypothetical protein